MAGRWSNAPLLGIPRLVIRGRCSELRRWLQPQREILINPRALQPKTDGALAKRRKRGLSAEHPAQRPPMKKPMKQPTAPGGSLPRVVRRSPYELGCLKRAVMGRHVHIHTSPPIAMEDRHGYTKHGHGRHYIAVGDHFDPSATIDMAWDRRCDASRWARRAMVLEIHHWHQC